MLEEVVFVFGSLDALNNRNKLPLDGVPSILLRRHVASIAFPLQELSLIAGRVPFIWNDAYVIPTIKMAPNQSLVIIDQLV